jgi:hypothetical protein
VDVGNLPTAVIGRQSQVALGGGQVLPEEFSYGRDGGRGRLGWDRRFRRGEQLRARGVRKELSVVECPALDRIEDFSAPSDCVGGILLGMGQLERFTAIDAMVGEVDSN